MSKRKKLNDKQLDVMFDLYVYNRDTIGLYELSFHSRDMNYYCNREIDKINSDTADLKQKLIKVGLDPTLIRA